MSDKKTKPLALNKMTQEDRYPYIAQAAKDLFAEIGFSATTMEKIAQRLGIGRTTLYDYFQSKDDMLYYLIDQRIDFDEHISLEGSVETKLQQLMVASLNRFTDNFTLYKILFTEKPAFANQTTNKLLQWQQKVLVTVSQVLSEAVATKQITPRCSVAHMVFVFQALLGQRMSQLLLVPQEVPSRTEPDPLNQHPRNTDPDWIQTEAETLTNLMIHGIGEIT